ncbi:MAG: alpha/beta hydrolase [Candidatus Villigracilaceae bacterium]
MSQILPTAEPFFFPGSGKNARVGCLVQHGFTGTPKEMRWLGEYLNGRGYTVCGMRLTGHATRPEDMIRSRWTDWLASVEDGYHLLHSSCEQVFLIGLSMGGVLALLAAAQLAVSGVVAMSTPYKLPDDWRLRHLKIISKFQPYLPKNDESPAGGWFGDAWKQHIAYPANPVRSIYELNLLLGKMRAALPQIRVPVLLISSRDDHYIVENSMEMIYADLTTPDKEKIWIEGSGHVITEEPLKEFVFEKTADFIARFAAL